MEHEYSARPVKKPVPSIKKIMKLCKKLTLSETPRVGDRFFNAVRIVVRDGQPEHIQAFVSRCDEEFQKEMRKIVKPYGASITYTVSNQDRHSILMQIHWPLALDDDGCY